MFSNDLVCDMLDFIDDNINRKITMIELSQKFFFHKDYLMRLFKKEIHVTILDYINRLRIFQSLKDLQKTDKTILNIGMIHGFSSLEYYSETFHKVMGFSPSIYREFARRSVNISEEDFLAVQEKLAEISTFFDMITKYRNNRKKILTKSLSIFK